MASLSQGCCQWASERGRTAHTCSGHTLLLGERAAFCPVRVYYPGTQLGRALQRGQASGIAAASPLFCQGGWISLSNKQEAVWPLPATCLKYLLCPVCARDVLGAQWEQDLFSREPCITESSPCNASLLLFCSLDIFKQAFILALFALSPIISSGSVR